MFSSFWWSGSHNNDQQEPKKQINYNPADNSRLMFDVYFTGEYTEICIARCGLKENAEEFVSKAIAKPNKFYNKYVREAMNHTYPLDPERFEIRDYWQKLSS